MCPQPPNRAHSAGYTLTCMQPDQESRWRLSSTGNRIMWSVFAGWLAWFVFHGLFLPVVIGVVVYLVLTAIADTSKRGQNR